MKNRTEIDDTGGLASIVPPLLKWYEKNARALLWRRNTDPYRVWVSEIMLQQTRVETVIPYYERFMARLPDTESLAGTDEDQLLKLWEGLGYYSRARNLQKAARTIMAKYGGKFPENYGEILSLPGIGQYTAGAIASICFSQPVPAVDGNVLRVIARLTGCKENVSDPKIKDEIRGMLADIYPTERSGDFTQSLMELGATVCLPNGLPRCAACPVADLCGAYRSGTQTAIPVKAKKTPRKKEQKTVFLLRCGDMIAVRKRAADVLLGELWEFPNAEGNLTVKQARSVMAQWGVSAVELVPGIRYKHVFTHIEWETTSFAVTCENMAAAFLWVTKEKLADDMALPSAFRPFLKTI